MSLIFASISKIVFFLIALTACIAFLARAFGFQGLESKDFMVLAMAAFSFFFSIKSTGTSDDMTECAPKVPVVSGSDKVKDTGTIAPFVAKQTEETP